MPELRTWIGRRQVIEDEIALTTVRRIAAMLDLEPDRFVAGTELPRHWFAMFFHNNAMQRDIGSRRTSRQRHLPAPHSSTPPHGGRPSRQDHGCSQGLRPARRVAEVVAITPKLARTGSIVVLTMRHTIESNGRRLRSTTSMRSIAKALHRVKAILCQSRSAPPAKRGLVKDLRAQQRFGLPLFGHHVERTSDPLRCRLCTSRRGLP